jgi:hypothetical protein
MTDLEKDGACAVSVVSWFACVQDDEVEGLASCGEVGTNLGSKLRNGIMGLVKKG